MSTASTGIPQPSTLPYRRRRRPINSCSECRRRKSGCSKSYPCTNCVKFSRTCIFESQESSVDHGPSTAAATRRFASDDESHAVSPSWSAESAQSAYIGGSSDVSRAPGPDEEVQWLSDDSRKSDLKPSMDNLCLHIGKLSLTGRIGGILRPKVVSTIEGALSRGRYRRQQSHETTAGQFSAPVVAYFKPCPLLPLTGFFGGGSSSEVEPYFPTQNECDFLRRQYFTAVDPFAHLLSSFIFNLTVDQLYDNLSYGAPQSDTTKALILAVCFAAATSLPFLQCQRYLGTAKAVLVERYKLSTEYYLQRADVLSSSNIEIMQAAVIYLIPICCGEVSRSSSIFVGALIRSAQIAGFDRDDTGLQPNLFESQSRKLLWCQLCFLDLRTAEAQGPQPAIQSTAIGMGLPWNANDWELSAQCPSPASETGWTDSTFSLIRYECYEVHRQIFYYRDEIDAGRASLSYVAHLVDEGKRRVEDLYLKRLDERIPVQRCAKLVGKLLVARFDLMLFHEHLPKTQRSPSQLQLRDRLLRSSLDIVENAAALETDPELSPWAWYASAYQQYHSLVFLLIELYQTPNLEEADRICAIANHVFGSSFGYSAGERSGEILHVLKEKLKLFPRIQRSSSIPEATHEPQPEITPQSSPQDLDVSDLIEEPLVWNEWDLPTTTSQPVSNGPELYFGYGPIE